MTTSYFNKITVPVLASINDYALRWLAFIWSFGVFLVLVILPPEWALMDDVGIHQLALDNFDGKNFWQYLSEFVWGDFGWGMFRPMYAAYSYVFYGAFCRSSQAAYLFLYLINTCIFWIWSQLFSKCIECSESDLKRIKIYQTLFFILCFLFVPHQNLFFFGSLQERLIICFGSIAFWSVIEMNRTGQVRAGTIAALLAGGLLALLSKATALFLIPPLTLWLLWLGISNRKYKTNFFCTALLAAALGIGFGYLFLRIRTGYTSSYQINSLAHFVSVMSPRTSLFLGVGSFCLILLVVARIVLRGARSANQLFPMIVWPLGLISYLIILIPWGKSAGYHFIPAGVFLIGSVLSVHHQFFSRKNVWIFHLSITAFIVFVLIASGFSMKKFIKEARQHYGLRKVVAFLSAELTQSERPIAIRMPEPCLEASFHMNSLLNRSNFVFMLKDNNDSFLVESEEKLRKFLVTNKECRSVPSSVKVQSILFQYPPWFIYEVKSSNHSSRT